MFVFEGVPITEKLRREVGTWGRMVTVSRRNGRMKDEEVKKNEAGTVPAANEVREAAQTGSVGTSRGLTLNLGDYQSARIDVWVTMPTDVEAVEETYRKCVAFAEDKVAEAVTEIRSSKK